VIPASAMTSSCRPVAIVVRTWYVCMGLVQTRECRSTFFSSHRVETRLCAGLAVYALRRASTTCDTLIAQ
jgi:hypothetical protein